MKKIALVATDVALPGERGLPRLHYLAEMFCKYGYYVDLITSNFQHWTKEFRTEESIRESRKKSHCHIAIVTQPGYKKNVELQRVISYRVYAKHVKEYLENNNYDLVYCLIPDNHIAAVSAKYAKERNIPFIVDVEDLWPEAMKMIFNVPVISDILFSNYTLNAITTYKLSDGLVGSSNTYSNEPLKYNIDVPNRVTVYVGNDIDDFDRGAKKELSKVNKPKNEFWLSYAGTLGTSYDIAALIKAADLIAQKGLNNIKIKIMGDGPLRKDFENLANKLSGNVEFLGYLSHDLMAAYLVKSDATINSFVKKAPQSFVSKIGDYLAAGKPMINTCVDPEFWRKVESEGFGINVQPEDPNALAKVIIQLNDYKNMCQDMGKIARRVAEREFNKAYTYLKIVDLVDSLVGDDRQLFEKRMDEVAANAI